MAKKKAKSRKTVSSGKVFGVEYGSNTFWLLLAFVLLVSVLFVAGISGY